MVVGITRWGSEGLNTGQNTGHNTGQWGSQHGSQHGAVRVTTQGSEGGS